MQTQQPHVGDERNPTEPILEQQTAFIKALIDEIWLRFSVRAREMRRSSSGFLDDLSMNQ
jgi:hypothetical protein